VVIKGNNMDATPPKLTKRDWSSLILLIFAGQLAWAVENLFFD
jgi:hypothetical protein